MKINAGNIFYTKTITIKEPVDEKTSVRSMYKAHKGKEFYAVLLGTTEEGLAVPGKAARKALHLIGWVTLDQVAEHFGDKATESFAKKLSAQFEDKKPKRR